MIPDAVIEFLIQNGPVAAVLGAWVWFTRNDLKAERKYHAATRKELTGAYSEFAGLGNTISGQLDRIERRVEAG